MTFPLAPIPDPNDDGFEEPVCEVCDSEGIMKIYVGGIGRYVPCDCWREEEDG